MAASRSLEVRHALDRAFLADFTNAERVGLMSASALFTGLSKQECLEIASCAIAKTYARDELLFMQGQPIRNLTLIQAGSVKLTQLSPNGNEVLLWMNGSGDAIEFPIDDLTCRHTCSGRAMEQCKALTWGYPKLQGLLKEFPQIRSNISRILSKRLSELEERFREVATEKVSKRLAFALLRLVHSVGKPTKGGVAIQLSREELAQMTGTTLFTISRILSRWADDGFVIPRREAVVICDQNRLEEIGNEEH